MKKNTCLNKINSGFTKTSILIIIGIIIIGGAGYFSVKQYKNHQIQKIEKKNIKTSKINTAKKEKKQSNILLSSYKVPYKYFGNPNSIDVSGNYAYITGGGGWLTIINISDAQNPAFTSYRELKKTDNLISTPFIKVSKNYAYIAGNKELKVFDISNPSNSVIVGSLKYAFNHPSSIAISGNYLYVAQDGYGFVAKPFKFFKKMDEAYFLAIIDISNPKHPKYVTSYPFRTPLKSIFISGNYVYITSNNNSLYTIDISDLSNLVEKSSYYNSRIKKENSNFIYVTDKYAYIARCGYNESGLSIIDISNPNQPKFVNFYQNKNILTCPVSLSIVGKYAYIANSISSGIDNVIVLDISNSLDIQLKSIFYDKKIAIITATFSNNYAYLITQKGKLAIMDLSALIQSKKTQNITEIKNKIENAMKDDQIKNAFNGLTIQAMLFFDDNSSYNGFCKKNKSIKEANKKIEENGGEFMCYTGSTEDAFCAKASLNTGGFYCTDYTGSRFESTSSPCNSNYAKCK